MKRAFIVDQKTQFFKETKLKLLSFDSFKFFLAFLENWKIIFYLFFQV